MGFSRVRNRVLNDRFLFGFGSPGEWGQILLMSVLIGMMMIIAMKKIGLPQIDFLLGAMVCLGAFAGIFLILSPSRYILTFFVVFMVVSHQFRSFFLLPAGGIVVHPREIMLFLLLAHLAAQLVLGRITLRFDIMHYFFFLYCVFFVLIAARGIILHPDLQEVVTECRYPVFLASYFVFVCCMDEKKDVTYFSRLLLGLALLIALASIAFFLYTLLTGNVVNTQNVLGEYVRRQIGPFLLQSVRPNGHFLFEISTVVLMSMVFCPDESRLRKMLYLILLCVLCSAIVITMMRTAYVALFVSLCVLFLFFLPKELQFIAWFLGFVGLLVLFLLFGLQLYDYFLQFIPGLGASIRGRLVEVAGGIRMFSHQPLLGSGMGSKFVAMGFVTRETQLSYAQTEYQTVHCVWLYYLFKGGLVGMLLVGLGMGGMVTRAHRIVTQMPTVREQYFMRGLLAAWLGQLIASLAMPRLTYPIGSVFLAMIAALFVLQAARIRREHTGIST